MSVGGTADERSGGERQGSSAREIGDRTATWIGRHQVVSFFGFAFAWTYAMDGLVYTFVSESPFLLWNMPRAWGPLLAATVVTHASGGSVRSWLGTLLDWRMRARWYLLAFALPIGIGLAVAAVAMAFGVEFSPPTDAIAPYVVGFLVVMFLAGGLEEFGWRGFAQPRLQERYSALVASVCIGALWVGWHLPLFFLFDLSAYDTGTLLHAYLPILIGQSAVFAAMFNATGGRVLPAMIAHAAGNLSWDFTASGTGDLPALLAEFDTQLVWLILVVALVTAYGPKYLAPRGPTPRIPGLGDEGDIE